MSRTAVVIVTHNSGPEIQACLDALEGRAAEVVVVDNASSDGTADLVRGRAGVQLLENWWNRGFAAAVNQGVEATEAELVLILNPDAVLQTGLEALEVECGQPGVAAAGGKLVGPDGNVQKGFAVRRFPSPASLSLEVLGLNRVWRNNPVNRRYRCLDLDLEQAGDVEQPAGAFLLVRREVWRRLGGFDETFRPVWFEDVDFLRRTAAAGYKVRYTPGSVAVHAGGHSVNRLSWEQKQEHWYGNLLTYAARHFGRAGRGVVCAVVVLGSIPRALAGVVRSQSLGPLGVYARVVRGAVRHFFGGVREGPKISSAFAVQ